MVTLLSPSPAFEHARSGSASSILKSELKSLFLWTGLGLLSFFRGGASVEVKVNRRWIGVVGAVLCQWLVAELQQAVGQSQPLLEEGTALLERGDATAAVPVFQKILTDYPLDPASHIARVQLGVALLALNRPSEAMAELESVATQSPPARMNEAVHASALFYYAAAAQSYASAQEAPARRKALDQAIGHLRWLISLYPTHPSMPDAYYSMALAQLLMGEMDACIATGRLFFQKHPEAPVAPDVILLVAAALAQQAKEYEAKGNAAKAKALMGDSRDLFADLAGRQADRPVLAAQAALQKGDLLAAAGDWKQAIEVYRAVPSKATLIQAQEAKVALASQRIKSNAGRVSREAFEELHRDRMREVQRLTAIATSPDPALEGALRSVACYVQMGSYDLARTMIQHLTPFTSPAQRMQLHEQRTLSLAMQGLAPAAQKAFEQILRENKSSPLIPPLALIIAQGWLMRETPDPAQSQTAAEQALILATQTLATQPKGTLALDLELIAASAETRLKKFDEADKRFELLLTNKELTPTQRDAARLRQAVLWISDTRNENRTGNENKIITVLREISQKAADPAIKTEAGFRMAEAQSKFKRHGEAAATYRLCAEVASAPTLAAQALSLSGQELERANKLTEAIATYTEVTTRYPRTSEAMAAFHAIARVQFAAGNKVEALAALDQILAQFQEPAIRADAILQKGAMLQSDRKWEEAKAEFAKLVREHPSHPSAPTAWLRQAQIAFSKAKALGNFAALSPEEKTAWTAALREARQAIDHLLEQYPSSDATTEALALFNKIASFLVRAKQESWEDQLRWFETREKAAQPTLLPVLSFARAAILQEAGKSAEALTLMSSVYKQHPAIPYATEDLTRYGHALIASGAPEEALTVFARLETARPTDPQAQSEALFGKATSLLKRGDKAVALPLFERLQKDYPWSERLHEAMFYQAQLLQSTGQTTKAMELYRSIIAARGGGALTPLKAEAMWASGEITEAITSPSPKLSEAAGYFEMIDTFLGAKAGSKSPDGLLHAGILYEKASKLEDARRTYRRILDTYPSSEAAEQARSRIAALPPPKS